MAIIIIFALIQIFLTWSGAVYPE